MDTEHTIMDCPRHMTSQTALRTRLACLSGTPFTLGRVLECGPKHLQYLTIQALITFLRETCLLETLLSWEAFPEVSQCTKSHGVGSHHLDG